MKREEKLKALPTLRLIQSSACQITFFNPERFNASQKSERRHEFSRDFPLLERRKVPGRRVKSLSNSPKHWPQQLCCTVVKLLCRGSANSNCHNVRLKHPRLIAQCSSAIQSLHLYISKNNIHELHVFYPQWSQQSPVFQKYSREKDELNFGLGGADQVNIAQSMVQCFKDTVSLLVQHSDTLPHWDQAQCFVMFVTQKETG